MLGGFTPQEIFVRFFVALICGLVIGLEREFKHKTVGIREYILVSLGSCAFAMITLEMVLYYYSVSEEVSIDPSRVVQGIITGIGFLGGGAILQSGKTVKGSATGAGIWVAGAIGIACGYGFFWLALTLTVFTFIVLAILGVVRAFYRDDIDSDKEKK